MIELSYVLPTYNRVEYLGECLLTLMEQEFDFNKFEVIVIDDGSTDSTPELMDYFTSEYQNITYHRLDKVGVEEARNYGNRLAKADIIGVCDSDDLYHANRTKITLDYFKKHPSVDIMNGSYIEIRHNGYPVRDFKATKLDKESFMAGKEAYFCHDNCAYRKDKILKTPYRNGGGQTDDWKLVHDWIEAGYKFGFTTKELCKVRTLRYGIMGARREQRGIKLAHE